MRILVRHKMANGDVYAIARIADAGYKVIVEKTNYREGRRWVNVAPVRQMPNREFQKYAAEGIDLDAAIALFEKKAKVEIERK